MEEKPKTYVELSHAREDEQRTVMDRIVQAGVCPFCPEHLERYHKEPVLEENGSWVLTKNQWPYQNTDVHLLVILKRHAEHLYEITEEEWHDLWSLLVWTNVYFAENGGMFSMRFGDPALSGATVRHLHAQLIVPKVDDASGRPMQVAMWAGSRS
ncbi:MAG: hypothetical protein AMXMBFR44_6340 [Candidatus Campbellbacteria bacterium]